MTAIYYINLDTRPDRRDFMEQQFHALGLSAKRLAATSPATLTLAATGDPHPDMAVREPMTASEMACLESHSRVWRAIAKGDDAFAVIFEDDLLMSHQLGGFIEALSPSPEWDVLRLETNFQSVRVGVTTATLGGREARRLMQPQSGAGAYVVTRDAAQKYLASRYFGAVPADTLVYAWPHVFDSKVWQLIPGLAAHLEQMPGRGSEPAAQSEIGKTRTAIVDRAQRRQAIAGEKRLRRRLRKLGAAAQLVRWFPLWEIAQSRREAILFDDVPPGYSR